MKSGDRLPKVLWFFTAERPVLEVEEIARILEISLSTAYRYVGLFCESGWRTHGSRKHQVMPACIRRRPRSLVKRPAA